MTEKQKDKAETVNTVATRGRTFQGIVTKVFPTRISIEIERTVYMQKYERYYKKKSKLHARIQEGMEIQIGDIVKIQETRPLSKIIHFMVIEIVKKAEVKEETQ